MTASDHAFNTAFWTVLGIALLPFVAEAKPREGQK
jgi:hypothetical protein